MQSAEWSRRTTKSKGNGDWGLLQRVRQVSWPCLPPQGGSGGERRFRRKRPTRGGGGNGALGESALPGGTLAELAGEEPCVTVRGGSNARMGGSSTFAARDQGARQSPPLYCSASWKLPFLAATGRGNWRRGGLRYGALKSLPSGLAWHPVTSSVQGARSGQGKRIALGAPWQIKRANSALFWN
jgi:hypothetical protein